MELYQNLPNFFKNDPTKVTKWANGPRYSIVWHVQIGGNYQNFHNMLVALLGNYKGFGQIYTPAGVNQTVSCSLCFKWKHLILIADILRDAFQKKSPYGWKMSQQGGRGSKKTFKIPYLKYLFIWELFQGGEGIISLFHFSFQNMFLVQMSQNVWIFLE